MKNFLKVLLLGTILVSGKFSFAGIGATPASQIDFSRLKEAPAAIAAESSSAATETAKAAVKNVNTDFATTREIFGDADMIIADSAIGRVQSWNGSQWQYVGDGIWDKVSSSTASAASTTASAAASASSSASNTANIVRYTSEEGALHAGMEGAGIISLQDLGDGTTKVVFNNGSSLIEDMPIAEVRSALIPNNAVYPGSEAAAGSVAATGGNTTAFADQFVQDNVGKGVYGVDTNIASKYDLDMGNTTNININTTNYNVVNSDGATIETAAGNFQKGVGNTVVDPKTGETVGNISMDGKVVTIKGTNVQLHNVGANATQDLAARTAAGLAAKAIYMGASEAGAKLAGYAADAATVSLTDAVVQNTIKSLGETAPDVFRSPVMETGILGTLKNLYRGDTGYEAGVVAVQSKLANTAANAASSVYNGHITEELSQAIYNSAYQEAIQKGVSESFATEAAEAAVRQASLEIQNLSDQVYGEALKAALDKGIPHSEAVKMAEAAREQASKELGEKAAAGELSQIYAEKTLVFNVPEYALGILEALEAVKTDEATKAVKIKAQEFQESQGAQFESKLVKVEENPMTATTVASAVTVMRSLLKNNKIDLGLLSVDLKDEKATQASGLRGSASQAAIGKSGSTGSGSSLTTRERLEVKRRRNLLLGEWAAAATQIGEGSNAISGAFYDRVKDFAQAANKATGTLGGLSAMNDSDRFVLFEITRGAALSAIELGLKGAVNLSDLEEVIATAAKDN